MKINELRVGNLIRSKLLGTVHAVTGLLPSGSIYTDLQESYSDADDWEPEILTPEILKNAGFRAISEETMAHPAIHRKMYVRVLVKSAFDIQERGSEFYWIEGNAIVQITGVHQLQNIFYDLTGEELTVLC